MKNQKGVTLIALIITIIVMLILVGVTIKVTLTGGLFDTARKAKDKTIMEQEKEELMSIALEKHNKLTDEINVDESDLPAGWTKSGSKFISPKGNSYIIQNSGLVVSAWFDLTQEEKNNMKKANKTIEDGDEVGYFLADVIDGDYKYKICAMEIEGNMALLFAEREKASQVHEGDYERDGCLIYITNSEVAEMYNEAAKECEIDVKIELYKWYWTECFTYLGTHETKVVTNEKIKDYMPKSGSQGIICQSYLDKIVENF